MRDGITHKLSKRSARIERLKIVKLFILVSTVKKQAMEQNLRISRKNMKKERENVRL